MFGKWKRKEKETRMSGDPNKEVGLKGINSHSDDGQNEQNHRKPERGTHHNIAVSNKGPNQDQPETFEQALGQRDQNHHDIGAKPKPQTFEENKKFEATKPLHTGQNTTSKTGYNTAPKIAKRGKHQRSKQKRRMPVYGALDLGTNNCRLLLARPNRRGFQIVDAFSRIIRLGEGVSDTGRLSNVAMERTIDALKICSSKMADHRVTRSQLVATQACRAAHNAQEFIDNVQRKTGLELEIICQETEAKLAVSGCITLVDEACDYVLIFDIGGGSSELIWLDIKKIKSLSGKDCTNAQDAIVDWVSLPIGVVTLAEKFGGTHVGKQTFDHMVHYVKDMLQGFARQIDSKIDLKSSKVHFLGTSGTVTTVAGVHLNLNMYDRQKIDGLWMERDEVQRVSQKLMGLSFEQRASSPCIGRERADLVLGGCAILEAMIETWPTNHLRVADRGLREGILARLMAQDGIIKPGQCWTSTPKRSKTRHFNPKRQRPRR